MRSDSRVSKAPMRPTSEVVTYDGQVRTGMVAHTARGYEAYVEGRGYVATFPTRTGATRAIFEAARAGSAK